jgi:hypothetical protein
MASTAVPQLARGGSRPTDESPPIPSEIGSSEMAGKTVVAIAMECDGTVVVAEESVAGTGKVFRQSGYLKMYISLCTVVASIERTQ